MSREDAAHIINVAKNRTSRRLTNLSKSLQLQQKQNSSNFQQMSLAEFSSIYNFSQILQDIEEIKSEVMHLKEDQSKSFVQSYISQKIEQMAKYLKKVKSRITDEAFNKLMADKARGRQNPQFPNIAKEVVKRCSQPESYLLFRKYHDYLPFKHTPSANEQDARQGRIIQKHIKRKQKLISKPSSQTKNDLIINNQSGNDSSQVEDFKIINPPEKVKEIQTENKVSSIEPTDEFSDYLNISLKQDANKLPSVNTSPYKSSLYHHQDSSSLQRRRTRTVHSMMNSHFKQRHTVSQQQDTLMRQVMEMFHYQTRQKQNLEKSSQLEQERELLQIVKIVSIERNLNQEQTQELILAAMRQLLEQELQEMQLIQIIKPLNQIRFKLNSSIKKSFTEPVKPQPSWSRASPMSSRVQILSKKLDNMKFFDLNSHVLESLQKEIKVEQSSIRREMTTSNQWYEEMESFYLMLKEGDMPKEKDAQTLFEVNDSIYNKIGEKAGINLELQRVIPVNLKVQKDFLGQRVDQWINDDLEV